MGVIGIALSGATVLAGQSETQTLTRAETQTARPVQRVVLVEVTGSRIPQRVVIAGEQVNSASPLRVFQGQTLETIGATTVGHALALDPDITYVHHR